MSQCYITNLGAGLVQRSVAEKKPIVFSRVCFNTEYVGKVSALFFKPVEWYGENLGVVVGSQSHVSVSGVSCPCNTQLAIRCTDSSKAWKTVSVFAHLEGEENEILFAAQSLMNGTIKHLFLMELPICLEGAFEDFGEVMDADVADAIEGGGGGGGDVPANMMTTNTEQTGLSGMKQWLWQIYDGQGTEDKPQEGDIKRFKILSIGSNVKGEDLPDPIVFNSAKQDFVGGAWQGTGNSIVVLDANGVTLNDGSGATWGNIIKAANHDVNVHASRSYVEDDGEGNLRVFGQTIQPNSSIQEDDLLWTFDSSGYLENVSIVDVGGVATIGVIVRDQNGVMVANGRVSGVSMGAETPLTFQSPIQLAMGYTITYQVIFSPL